MLDYSLESQLHNALIYVVDDEAHNIRLLDRMLRKHGYTNISCAQEATTLEEMVSRQLPDLLLLDLHLPQISGLELLDRLEILRTSNPPVPVLVLTGDSRTDVRRAALQKGARDFVNKPFDPPEVLCRIRNLLETRVSQCLLLRQNSNLEQVVQKRTAQLQESQMDLMRRLAVAAEYRDDQTGLHIGRVSRYSALLGRAMGLDEDECERLLHASQLHDIGKIGIPDSILLKNGKLDPQEWETMKTHVLLGGKILQNGTCPLVRLAEQIALTHHERWDGRGYPAGIMGEDIPLVGRIVSVADVFDALTSERPYKRAWSVPDAVAEIVKNRGGQFDPTVVDRFVEILPDLLQVGEDLGNTLEVSPAHLPNAFEKIAV